MITTADALNLRDAVIADGLVLTRENRAIVLHTVDAGRTQLVGRFADVRDAWMALDAIDAPDAELLAAA